MAASTLFINTDGKPLDKQPIPWSTPPDAIAYSYPYLVSLNLAKHQIEVRNPATRTRLQTISLPAVATLHVPPPNVSLVHAGKLFFVASPTQVWRMGATDYEVQINELIQAEHLDEAIRLIETLESVLLKESKEEKLREVQMLKAQRLFEKKKYEESMTLFASVSAPPERVIKLFPSVIAGDISIWPDEDEDGHVSGEEGEEGDEEEEETAQEGSSDTAASTLGFETIAEEEEEHSPKSKGASDHGENGETPDAKAGTKNDSSSSSGEVTPIEKPKSRPVTPELKRADTFITMRNSAFSRKYSDTASIFSFGSRKANTLADDASMLSKKESQIVDDTPKPLEGDELKKGAQELARTYLNDVRRKLTKYFDREGKAVDPLSILASGSIHEASKKDPLEASFLMLDDPSDEVADPVQQRIEKLMETCRLVDTTLFRAYMLIRPALVGPLVRIQNHCDPDVVKEKLRDTGKYDDLVDFLERKQLHRDALELLRFFGQADEENKAPNLHGPQRTVTYLERLKSEHIELILEFSTWPLKADSALGMEVFIGDTGNSEMLPRPQVADFLEAQDQRLAILYLEHIITELHDQTPEFHTRLAGLYLRILTQTTLTNAQKESWHTRFLGFLEASDQYRAEKVLGQLPRDADDFLEPRAVVLSKMGRHKAALEIYVFRLHNDDKAEDYCSRVHAAEPDADVFHILLSLYLRPPSPYDPQLAPALGILSRHGARLDASEALELIPATVVVRDLETYFETRIRAANARVTGNRMLAALRKSHLVDVQERLLGARNKHATVGDENVCPVCHKRLGMSVLWRLPRFVIPPSSVKVGLDGADDGGSGVVVHYGCAKKAAF